MSIFNYKEQPGYFARLKEAIQVTKKDLVAKIDDALGLEKEINATLLEDLERILISTDIGVDAADHIINKIRVMASSRQIKNIREIKRLIRSELLEILKTAGSAPPPADIPLRVAMIIGVNGVGKTTTIGKLARLYRKEGKEVLICAADTFRAAAVEQLGIWAERNKVEMIKQKSGTDPSAVLFDAIAASKARLKDVMIVDTAGRLHTKSNLMQELEKMKRVAGRELPGAPHDIFLVIDATTGQNGLAQAREFTRSVGVTGLIVTKLDGTAKGGIVVAITKELRIPIAYIGVGEEIDDLMVFSPEAYVDGLFD
ncbi:MAG TPA: signal recognition particle-docking protein FtsY [Acidobacteriota bacterium]|jgi:fused signal recognition particle receptor|nr:signal recognition particle-docking protein FtsY [Acidobacteriota bacterium]